MLELDDMQEQLRTGGELAELCRTHGIEAEWLRQSRDLDDLLGHVARECEERLDALERGTAEGVMAARALEKLRLLVRFGNEAARLRNDAPRAPAFVTSVADLERVRHGRTETPNPEIVLLLNQLGSLCHKANNPLTSLIGRAQILQIQKPGDPQIKKAASVIEESAKRVSGVVNEMAHAILNGKERLKA